MTPTCSARSGGPGRQFGVGLSNLTKQSLEASTTSALHYLDIEALFDAHGVL
jgi:hypothetical protein